MKKKVAGLGASAKSATSFVFLVVAGRISLVVISL